MNERTQFYIRQDAEFGRMDPSIQNAQPSLLSRIPNTLKYLFRGISMGLMLSIYTFVVVFILYQLNAPLPYVVKNAIQNIEYTCSHMMYDIQHEGVTWQFISQHDDSEVRASFSPENNQRHPTVEILE